MVDHLPGFHLWLRPEWQPCLLVREQLGTYLLRLLARFTWTWLYCAVSFRFRGAACQQCGHPQCYDSQRRSAELELKYHNDSARSERRQSRFSKHSQRRHFALERRLACSSKRLEWRSRHVDQHRTVALGRRRLALAERLAYQSEPAAPRGRRYLLQHRHPAQRCRRHRRSALRRLVQQHRHQPGGKSGHAEKGLARPQQSHFLHHLGQHHQQRADFGGKRRARFQ